MLRVDGLKSHCVIRYNFKNPCPRRHTCMQAWVHVHFKHFCLVCFSKTSNSLKQVSGRDVCWGFSRNRLSREQRISRGCLRLQGSHFRIQGLLMQWKLLTSEGLSEELHIWNHLCSCWLKVESTIWIALEARTFGVPPSVGSSPVESFWSNSLQDTPSIYIYTWEPAGQNHKLFELYVLLMVLGFRVLKSITRFISLFNKLRLEPITCIYIYIYLFIYLSLSRIYLEYPSTPHHHYPPSYPQVHAEELLHHRGSNPTHVHYSLCKHGWYHLLRWHSCQTPWWTDSAARPWFMAGLCAADGKWLWWS